MREKYQQLFNTYLKLCKKSYDPEKPYDNLEECIKTCSEFKRRLLGMNDLLEEAGEISAEESKKEARRIIQTFSSTRICNAYMTDGEVVVFAER